MLRHSEIPSLPEKQPLAQMATHLLEECRMVMPGIQALFGFQLIAVYNAKFWELLGPGDQYLHVLAMFLVAVAIALVMTPAALHRQTHMDMMSRRFIVLASRLLLIGMVPLLVAINIDCFLIANLVLHDRGLSAACTAVLAACFVSLWFIMPRWHAMAHPGEVHTPLRRSAP